MSTTVDNRVVQMRFDNEEFEKKATKSISTLDKLKNALKFSGASKNIDKVNESFKEVDANPLLKAINGINGGLTTMVAKATLVNRATNALIDTTKRFVNSMTLDQVNAGWDKYAEKTSAVQTIMAATSKDFKDTGTQMAYVNSQLEKLNWFTDETSYNFTDMVGNIGKFTSNGIKLDKSVTAMQGIATWAARSGANANEASRAMYNLSQALSVGSVKLIDWKSIENANMATAEFKENALEAAAALGTLKRKGDGSYVTMKNNAVSVSNFNEALSDAWFTSDVLLKVLDKYGGFTNKLYEVSDATDLTATQLLSAVDKYIDGTLDLQAYATATGNDVEELRGYLDELSSSTYELGRKSFQSAQEAKTFAEAISATSDAVSTGWMKSFEIIFGDYEEAKKLWTNLSNIMYEIFAASGDIRNELLGEWRAGGGRKTMLEGVNEAMEAIFRVIVPLKEAFREIFPAKTSQDLLKITDKFKKLMQNIQLDEKAMLNLKRIARGLFSAFDLLVRSVQKLGNTIKNLVAPEVDSFLELIVEVLATAGDMIYIFRNMVIESGKLNRSFGKAGASVKDFLGIFTKLFNQLKQTDIGKVSFKLIQNAFEGAASAGKKLLTYISEVASKVAGLDHLTFANLSGIFSQIGTDAQNWFKGLVDEIKGSDGFLERFKETVQKACEATGASFDNLTRRVGTIFNTIKYWLSEVPWGALISIAFGLGIMKSMNNFTLAMTNFTKAIANLTQGVGGLVGGINNVMTSVANMFNAITSSIKAPTYIKIAKAIGIVAASLAVLALLPTDKLEAAAIVFAGVVIAFGIFTKAMSAIPEIAVAGMTAVQIIAKVVVALAASLLLLAEAFKELETIDPNILLDSVMSIGLLIGILATAATVLGTKIGPFATAMGKTSLLNSAAGNLLAMSASILIIANALKSIESISFRDINATINAMVLSIAAVVGLTFALSKISGSVTLKNSASLLLAIGAVATVLKMVQTLQNFDISELWETTKKTAILIGALAVLFAATKLAGGNAAKAGALMAGLGIGIYTIIGAIVMLGSIKEAVISNGIKAIQKLTICFALLMAFSSAVGKEVHKMSVTLLAASAAIGILAVIAGIVGYLDDGAMKRGLTYVALLSTLFTMMIVATRNATDMSKSITTMTIAAVALGTMIAALTFAMKDGPENLKVAAMALSELLVAFGLMGALMSKAQISIKSIAVAEVALAGLATILGLLVTLAPDLDQAIDAAAGVTILAAGLTLIMRSLPVAAAAGAVAPAAFAGIGAALTAMVGIATILGVILAIVNTIDVPSDLPQKCLTIGQALGNIVAGFVGGSIGGSIDVIGKGIKAFNESMNGVDFEAVKAGLSCVIDFAKGLAALAAVNFLEVFTGKPNLPEFVVNLGLLGTAITAYSQAVQNADIPAVEASVPGAQALVEVANALPRNGGLFSIFTGTKDLGAFAKDLVIFGGALTAYSLIVKLCDNSAVEASIASAQALVQIADTIPNTGGILALFTGDNDFATFGKQLILFGLALAGYSAVLHGVDFDLVSQSVDAAGSLVEIANAIPDDGLLQSIVGKQGLDDFGKKLKKFGESMADYYSALDGITIDSTMTASLIADLNKLIEFIPNADGVNLDTITEFSEKIAEFGWNLWEFFSQTSQIQDPTPLDVLCQNVIRAVETLNTYVDKFKKAGEDCVAGFLEGISGDDSLRTVTNSGATLGDRFLKGFREVTGWHSPWTTMIQAVKDAVGGLFKGSDESNADDAGAKLATDFSNGFDEAEGTDFSDKATEAANDLKSGADEAGDTAEEAGAGLGARFNKGLGDKLSGFADKLKTTAQETSEKYSSTIKAGGFASLSGLIFGTDETDTSANALSDALTDVQNKALSSSSGKTSKSYSSAGTTAADAFLTAFENKLSDLDLDLTTIDLEDQLWEATVGQTATDSEKNARETSILVTKIGIQNEKVNQANQKYAYTIKKFGENSETAKKAYQSLLQEQISLAELMAKVNESRETAASTQSNAMVEYAKYIAESKEGLLKAGFTMEEISRAAANKTGYNLQQTTDTMTTSVKEAVSTAMGTVSTTYLQTAESTLGALTSNFQSYGTQYATSLGNGMATNANAVTTGTTALTTAAKTAITQDSGNWYNLGAMCVEGFKQGILDKVAEVATAAREVAIAAYEAAQAALAVFSPSRKFRWLGEMSGTGLSEGLLDMSDTVANSGTEVSQGAIDAARKTIAQIADVIDTDPALHPTIAPVMDMSSIEHGVSQMNKIRTPILSTYVAGERVAHVASSLSQYENGIRQPLPQTTQNETQNVSFVQNNYSPKALNRSEIYRNTSNQFAAFKEAISKV